MYLDANADAPVLEVAWQAYCEAAADFADPGAAHALGQAAALRLAAARGRIAARLGARPDEVVLTSGGTEADALALIGMLRGGDHVVTSTVEHAAVAKTLTKLEAQGVRVTRVAPPRSGRLNAHSVVSALRPETRLVSLVFASNETGVLQPIIDVSAVCRRRGVRVHTDAVQAAGKLDLDFGALGVDLMSLSGHKLGASGGTGALLVRRGLSLGAVVTGGGQEHGRRAGLEDVAGAASLAAALEAQPTGVERRRLAALRDQLDAGLRAQLPEVEVLGDKVARLPNTSCVRFPGCEGDGLMMLLDLQGIAVSTGSACSSGSIEPSPILLGMGLSRAEARQALRFSLPASVTQADVERAVAATVDAVRQSR